MSRKRVTPRCRAAGARAFTLRATGVVIALGVFLIGVGVVGLLAVYSSRRPGAGPASLPKAAPVMPPTPVDLSQTGLSRAGRARVQFVDKADPTRVSGTLEWASLQPTSAGRARVDAPRAIVYLRDGQAVSIRAAEGEIVYPAGRPEQTESGTFSGGVLISLLPVAPDLDQAPGAEGTESAAATAQIFTRTIDFNVPLGEVTMPGAFRASGPRFELSARGLRVVGDQVQGRVSLTIDQTDYLYLAPQRPQGGPDRREGGAGRAGSDQQPSAGETFYHASISHRMRLVRGGMTLDAARLETWARLVGGSLPPGALGELEAAPASSNAVPQDRADSTKTARAELGEPLARSPAIPGEPLVLFNLAGDRREVLVATWAGPLTVVPLDARPAALEDQDLVARLSGSGSGGSPLAAADSEATVVRGSDDDSGAWLLAPVVRYAATSRVISILGTPDTPARLGLKSQGEIAVAEASLNLGSGIGTARGPLTLTAATDAPGKPRRITCGEQADFGLSLPSSSSSGGLGVGNKLRFVAFGGGVRAQDGPASLTAQSVRLDFLGKERPTGPLDGLLERLHAEGAVRAVDADGASLACESLDVGFEPSPTGKEADPTDVLAQGSVRGSRSGWDLETERLAARLGRDERNRIIVGSATAEGGAKVRGRGVEAEAETLRADVASRLLDLLGPRVTLSRDGGTITGTQMRLDGFREELTVFGAGTLDYAPVGMPTDATAAPLDAPRRARVEWTRSCSFANIEGKAECAGAVHATIDRTPLETDDLRAERVELRFTPGEPGSGFESLASVDGGDTTSRREPASPRRLLRAEAAGLPGVPSGAPGSRARLESRRFAREAGEHQAAPPGMPLTGERPVERLLLAEGDRLIADEAAGSLRIPGAGRALIDDRRPSEASVPAVAPGGASPLPSDLSGARGTTLLSWGERASAAGDAPKEAEGLVFDRRSGLVTISEPARIVYRASPEQGVITIDARRAEAQLRVGGSPSGGASAAGGVAGGGAGGGNAGGEQASLVSATAQGDVVARTQQGTSLTADRLHFDALGMVAEASANPPGRVVLTEPASATPMIARTLRWDLARQRATIVEPAPTAIPR